jgi:hypothetical protein
VVANNDPNMPYYSKKTIWSSFVLMLHLFWLLFDVLA